MGTDILSLRNRWLLFIFIIVLLISYTYISNNNMLGSIINTSLLEYFKEGGRNRKKKKKKSVKKKISRKAKKSAKKAKKSAKKAKKKAKKSAKKARKKAKKTAKKARKKAKKAAKKKRKQEKKARKKAKKASKKNAAPVLPADPDPSALDSIDTGSCNYLSQIKTPKEMNMGSKGTWNQIGKNLKGLTGYYDLAVTGDSKASKMNGEPLGCAGFRKTGSQCMLNGVEVDEYTYYNDVPGDPLPKNARGLVPGMLGGVAGLVKETAKLSGGLTSFAQPIETCNEYEMLQRGPNSEKYNDTKPMSINDVKTMNPCWFPNKINPETGENCKEKFTNYRQFSELDNYGKDNIITYYYAALGLGFLYILHGPRLFKTDLLRF